MELLDMPSLDLMNLRMEALDEARLLQFYDDMGLWDMKKRVKQRLGVINNNKGSYSNNERTDIPMTENELENFPF